MILWVTTTAQAQPVSVGNPSFESGDTAPDGWRLPQGKGAWTEEAAQGGRAIAVTGDGTDQSANFWLSQDVPIEPDTTYRLRFQARHAEGLGRSLFTGFLFHNRDLPELTREWQRFTTYLTTPSAIHRGQAQLRFGQYDIDGTAAFDDIELVKTTVVYRRMGDIELGEGERIKNGRYLFNAPFMGESTNHARPLAGFNCYFNKPRWVFSPGDWVVYRHKVGSLTQTGGGIEVVIGHHTGGELEVEAGTDGKSWTPVGVMSRREAFRADLPASLFPAKEVWIRLRMAASATSGLDLLSGGSTQVHGYAYHAELADAPGDFFGATRFVAVTDDNPSLRVSFDDFGAAIPWKNTLRLQVANQGGEQLEIRPAIIVRTASGLSVATQHGQATLPPGGAMKSLDLPYEIPGIGDVTIEINLGGASGYRAETNFSISPLHEANYGALLPGSTGDVALWWAASGWKVSRDRPAPREEDTPREEDAALRIRAARNEHEAAQVVLRPSRPLKGLRAVPQALVNAEGAELPASALSVFMVGYVPVEYPSDALGTPAPWPDPLPPLNAPADLDADENQPLWIQLNVPPDAPPGLYRGAVLLEADGWRAEVPVEAEVFDFTLPDEKSCQTALGFDGNLAAQYHGVSSAEDRRVLAGLYARAFSEHHISLYELGRKLIYPELDYTWPNHPKWAGNGRRVTGGDFQGGGAMQVADEDTERTFKVFYDQRFDIPKHGFKVAFRHRSAAPGHEFVLTRISHHN